MVMQRCQYCGKEFMPRNDNRHHVFCSNKCRKDHINKLDLADRIFREEIGMEKKRQFASNHKQNLE